MLVGLVRNGRVEVFCCVRGNGGRWAWHTTVLPTRWTPFPFRPMLSWLVWCWPACVWSVYGDVLAAAAVLLVHGCLSHLMVGLFVVAFFLLLPALSRRGLAGVQHCSPAPPQSRQQYSKVARNRGSLMVWQKARVGGTPPSVFWGKRLRTKGQFRSNIPHRQVHWCAALFCRTSPEQAKIPQNRPNFRVVLYFWTRPG